MFVANFKVNKSMLFKIFLIIVAILIIILFSIAVKKVFDVRFTVNDNISKDLYEISGDNYSDVLKEVHDNLDTYINQKIKFTGFVYRIYDFSENQFVLARNMIIADNQSVIVGFLCNCKTAKDYPNNTWVEITGRITKGDYHGDMPILEIDTIKKVDKPNDEFVYPPSDSFIPTSTIL